MVYICMIKGQKFKVEALSDKNAKSQAADLLFQRTGTVGYPSQVTILSKEE